MKEKLSTHGIIRKIQQENVGLLTDIKIFKKGLELLTHRYKCNIQFLKEINPNDTTKNK